MKLLGFEITRAPTEKAQPIPMSSAWQPGWFPLVVQEPFTGAWQRDMEWQNTHITSYHAVFACVTLIASDISKLRVKFIREIDGVWRESKSPAYDPVLRAPNHYQNSQQFWESYILSKLLRGNVYVIKARDERNVVTAMHVLDPCRVRPLIADNGDVFYELNRDNLAGRTDDTVKVPASEIIHDRMNCLWHPLCGISPLYAAYLAATQGLTIQRESVRFFENQSVPGGILSAPGRMSEQTVKSLRDQWTANYSGNNRGKIAVLAEGLKFEAMAVKADDAQLLEQLKATSEWVCSVFHVPPYKIGITPAPSYNNVQALNVEYYAQCLQVLIEAAERCLDAGLEMGSSVGVEFDLDGLLRMDTVSQVNSLKEALSAGLISPNEGRARLGYGPVEGGDSPMVQQQMFSLAALAERDENKPFAKPAPPPPAAQADQEEPDDDESTDNDEERAAAVARYVQQVGRLARRVA